MMKKFTLMVFISFFALFAKDVDLKPFQKLEMFRDGSLTLKRAYDHGSLYQIHFVQNGQNYSAFLTKDKKVLIAGEAVRLATKEQLLLPKEDLNMNLIKKEADFIYGTGKTKLIVVTDPECHYCQVFQSRWSEIKDKYTLYVYLYPLGHHKEAKQMSYHVMNQKTDKAKANALISIALDSKREKQAMQSGTTINVKKAYKSASFSKNDVEKFENKLMKNQSLADTLGVRGTPAVYDVKGQFVMWSRLF